jgi:hypothetical protein
LAFVAVLHYGAERKDRVGIRLASSLFSLLSELRTRKHRENPSDLKSRTGKGGVLYSAARILYISGKKEDLFLFGHRDPQR